MTPSPSRSYGNVMVVLSKKRSLDITIGDGLAHFTIRRSRNKRGQRFLGFYIVDQEIFSPQTHGMMGEWSTKSGKNFYFFHADDSYSTQLFYKITKMIKLVLKRVSLVDNVDIFLICHTVEHQVEVFHNYKLMTHGMRGE